MVAGVGKVTRLEAAAAAPHRLPEVIHCEQIGAQAPPPGDVPKSPHAPRSVQLQGFLYVTQSDSC